ncbi:hypothetical protein PRIPAC_80979 [Pristionchus pacificus]|uniref:G protein-coupled receptor n=1 Tax=Pristionchus pacificus TaxID=54126 RepID=A0A2A6CJG1_PRIPA|nr:hypothetical protein PRIPAC_80979 [Pristionchus pacificus]|eukprot:PDM78183.1 G protein-coupled receptor [Pristionchus pacificus]
MCAVRKEKIVKEEKLILNTIAMVCFIRETPPNQSSIRVYLIFIQVLLTFNDLFTDGLFKPIPLFSVEYSRLQTELALSLAKGSQSRTELASSLAKGSLNNLVVSAISMELADHFFIAKSFENIFVFCQDIIFIIATFLNIIALLCLARECPPHQSAIRVYLIIIQVLLLVNDVYIDASASTSQCPYFPSPQAIATGYCAG